jgi:DNA (cytosine-5)-methyltransferase 1
MKNVSHGSLFSGLGGFDLAAEWMGWENVFHCEWNEFGQRILKYYWPKAKSYEDITKTDFTIYRGKIDILTGGFPCQPYSAAGKRLGTADARHLWPEMLRAIREIKPAAVVAENVSGLLSWNGGLVFNEVQADLEAEGYEVQPVLLPAASVGAPHRRDRVWFVAYATSERNTPPETSSETKRKWSEGLERAGERGIGGKWIDGLYRLEGHDSNTNDKRGGGVRDQGEKTRARKSNELFGSECGIQNAEVPTNTDSRRQPSKEHGQKESGRVAETSISNYWQNFPTQSPICGGNDGIPTKLDGITFPKWRNESIKGYGNAIVPQVAYQIFKALIQSIQQNKA